MRGNKFFRFIDRYLGIPVVIVLGFISRLFFKRSLDTTSYSSILIIKLSALGDTILLWPVLKSLKMKFRDASILMVGTDINKAAIDMCPYVDERVLFDVGLVFNPIKLIGFINFLRERKFDIVLDFDQWLRISPIIGFFSGTRKRVGFFTSGQHRHYLYTDYVHHKKNQHELDCFFDILRCIGIDSNERHLEYYDMPYLDFYPEFIGFFPGMPEHGWQRQWPKEYFIELGKMLLKKYNYKIGVIGSIKERSLVTEIVNSIDGNNAFCIVGLSLSQLAGVLKRCKVLVCGNTGIMHLACAVGMPVVALHGPTDPVKWGPIGEKSIVVKSKLPCSPCLYLGYEYKCKTRRCMESITVEEVFEMVKRSIP